MPRLAVFGASGLDLQLLVHSTPQKMKRIEQENHARYLTFSCYHRLGLFEIDRVKDAFVEQLSKTRERTNFHLLAWVIMPEHVHLLIWPQLPEYPVSRVTSGMKRAFGRVVIGRWRELDAGILKKLEARNGQVRFWQHGGGYDRNIMGGHELNEKIRYIHQNPVQRGLVERAEDWEWSSARWYAGAREGVLSIDELKKPGS